MIRKLASGEYRLYSRKVNPKTGKRRNLGTFKSARRPRSMSATCNISSVTDTWGGRAEQAGKPNAENNPMHSSQVADKTVDC